MSSKILFDLFCFMCMSPLLTLYIYIPIKKVAFAEFYFLKRSFRISLFLNFQILRPTVTCFVCLFFFLFACLYFSSNKAQSSKQ